MIKLLLRWASISVAFWAAATLLGESVQISGDWLTYAGIAFIFGLVNATIGTLTKLFTFPLTFLSLGLWLWAVNALMLLVTDYFSDSLLIENFGWALVASLIISVVSAVINKVVDHFRQ